MLRTLIALLSIVGAFFFTEEQAQAGTTDELIARLDRIETENKMLRARLIRLERTTDRKRNRPQPVGGDRNNAYAAIPAATSISVKAPAAGSRNWTGIYIGGQIGATGLDSRWSNAQFGPSTYMSPGNIPSVFSPFNLQSDHSAFGTSAVAGLHIGYRRQFNNFVLGVSNEFIKTSVDARGSCFPNDGTVINQIVGLGERTGSFNCSAGVRWINSLTGSIGITDSENRFLFFAKAGAAFSRRQMSISPTTVTGGGPRFDTTAIASTISENQTGLVVGAGIEFAVLRAWSVQFGYDYIDFGHKNQALSPSLANPDPLFQGALLLPVQVSMQERLHLVKVGLSYRFQ